jgi:RND family efflux transporter MFP subunit
MEPPDEIRPTDYGQDVAATESGPASARVDPDMTARVRKIALVAVVALALAFVAVSIDRYVKYRRVARATDEAAAALPAVDVISAQPVGRVQRLVLPGQTAAWHTSTIYARVNGYVGKWFVDIGDAVHGGQVLALIETPDLDAQLAAARAQLRASQAQELVRKAEAELSRTTYERWRDSPKGVVSEQEREEKRADYASAEARVKSAQADVALAQARVDQYAALAQFKEVTAPYDGVITNRDIDIGNLVTAGSTSATTRLYVMTQNDPIRIFVDVPQSAAADLIDGSTVVQIQSGTAGGGREYTAKLTRTSHAVDLQARTVRAEVDLANASQQFVPGMYLKVAFTLAPKGLVQVPAAALLFRAAGPQVAQVDASGRLSFRNVTIARDDGSVVELASGVAPGDHLALNVSSQIRDGEQVSARQLDATAVSALTAAGR